MTLETDTDKEKQTNYVLSAHDCKQTAIREVGCERSDPQFETKFLETRQAR